MTLQALKAAVVAGDGDAAIDVVAGTNERDVLLAALVAALSPTSGVPWRLAWRVKRSALAAALHAIGRVIARYWDHAAIDPIRDRAYTLIPPREWIEPRIRAAFGTQVLVVELPLGRSIGLVRVPAGRFEMGERESDVAGGYRHETNQREVSITRDYWLGATVVTRAEWAAVMSGTSIDDERPAIVTWPEALAFANALSRAHGLPEAYVLDDRVRAGFVGPSAEGYRLATEAEWERAARAGTTTATYNGDLENHYGKNTTLEPIAWYGQTGAALPSVACKLPNAYGLYDMLGLAWEFVFDRYTALPDTPMQDPLGNVDPLPPGGRDARVQRGGGINQFASLARASVRLDGETGSFRVCRTASESRVDLARQVPDLRTKRRDGLVLELPHGSPRRLRSQSGSIFVGTAGGLTAPMLHELIVLDTSGTVLHRWPTRFLVSDIAVCGETVWISLGPGYVESSESLGAAPPHERACFINAPALESIDEELVIAERFGDVHVDGRVIGGVKGSVYGVAATADHIYAAYGDGKCRVFDRRTGSRSRKMLSVKGAVPLVAVVPGVLVVADPSGEVSTYDPTTLEQTGSFQTPPLSRIEIQHGRLVTVGRDGVAVFELDGRPLFRWEHTETGIVPVDALLFADHLIVALGDDRRSVGALMRVPI